MAFARRAFTLLEIIVAIAIISVALSTAVYVLNNSTQFLQTTEIKIKNINVAREGLEAIFQIRDSNRLRRSGNVNECRLKIDPLTDAWSDGCTNDPWIASGYYILEQTGQNQTTYFKLTPIITPMNYTDGIQENESIIGLCEDIDGRYACNDTGANTRRIVEVNSLYKKIGNEILNCENGQSISGILCWQNDAKELHFCVHAWDRRNNNIQTLCSILTNFQQ